MGKEDFYCYLQICNFFIEEIETPDLDENPGIIQIFMDACDSVSSKGIIGKLYKRFMSMNKNSTDYIKQRREKEASIAILEEVWLQLWKNKFSTTNYFLWQDCCWKNLIRFFITPNQKSRSSGSQVSCRWECGVVSADFFQVFWSCPNLKTFKKEVEQLISETLDVALDFSFISMYLGKLPEGLSKRDTYLLKIFMVANKNHQIIKCWLQQNPPTLKLFINIINSIHSMETLTFTLRLQKEKRNEYWEKWDFHRHRDSTLLYIRNFNLHTMCCVVHLLLLRSAVLVAFCNCNRPGPHLSCVHI